jgi:hypothetical protein
MKNFGPVSRFAALVAVVSAVIAAALVGGAGSGRAATSFNITLGPLIGTTGNLIPQVSYGGKIGYHVHVENAGDSTTQHAQILVTSDLATFSDVSDTANCAVNPKNAHQMICTPFGGTFAPGAIFDTDLRFTAPLSGPATGEQVSTVASISVAAQTVGGNKTNGTTLTTSEPVPTNIVENTTKADTFLRKNENAGTGKLSLPDHPQNFSMNTPPALFGDPFGIAVSMHDIVGALCAGCFGAYTQVTIPSAPLVNAPGNPFFNGASNPYGWTMNAQYSSGSNFKLHGVVHIDDSGDFNQVPSCASLVTVDNPAGNPTAAVPACYDTLDQISNKKMLVATGRGLENGNWTWN